MAETSVDQEIDALQSVYEALAKVDQSARRRILRWSEDYFFTHPRMTGHESASPLKDEATR